MAGNHAVTYDRWREKKVAYALLAHFWTFRIAVRLEAKCYSPGIDGSEANHVGVREISRLISRLRDRQFGVLVTTSVIARQGYEEVREDRHPIIFIAGKDIAEILIQNGYSSPESVQERLSAEYPII
jgi:Restriction endonuclease